MLAALQPHLKAIQARCCGAVGAAHGGPPMPMGEGVCMGGKEAVPCAIPPRSNRLRTTSALSWQEGIIPERSHPPALSYISAFPGRDCGGEASCLSAGGGEASCLSASTRMNESAPLPSPHQYAGCITMTLLNHG